MTSEKRSVINFFSNFIGCETLDLEFAFERLVESKLVDREDYAGLGRLLGERYAEVMNEIGFTENIDVVALAVDVIVYSADESFESLIGKTPEYKNYCDHLDTYIIFSDETAEKIRGALDIKKAKDENYTIEEDYDLSDSAKYLLVHAENDILHSIPYFKKPDDEDPLFMPYDLFNSY